MTSTFRRRLARFAPGHGLVCYLAGTLACCTLLTAQDIRQAQAANREEGIPVTDPLVIAKCGNCHARDERGNMQRISWERTTPENWQAALKQMILGNGVSVTPSEARAIVRYLSTSHGLAPEEARPVMYDAERRIHEESNIPSDNLRDTCAKCHSFARPLSWRRSPEDWKRFADSHAARYNIRTTAEAVAFLSSAAPLHTPVWDAWKSRSVTKDLAGRWLATASIPGRGNYYGEMQIDRAGDDEYTTRVTLASVRDGTRVIRSGRIAVFGGYAWRGRSKGEGPANSTPDDLSSEAREVLLIDQDQSTAEGRWFWGQYQEFELNVRLQRASSNPTLIGVDRSSLKTGSQAGRIRLTGDNFPAQVALTDLDFGPGVTVGRIVARSPSEIVAELDVAADAPLGKRDVVFSRSVLPGAMAIYDRIDYVKVTPDSTVAAFGDRTHPRGYRQFEAIGYQRGADGRQHTTDDVALGPVEVAWSLQVFHAAEGSSSDRVGTIGSTGLFTPAAGNPNNNFDVWVTATARDEKDRNGTPLVGKSYMVVTVPTYTFNGRQYVRDLDRWVDDGPATDKP
jgi:quinohemoprotein amine dehydrogenase